MSLDDTQIDRVLHALERRLSLAGERFEIVVIGGSALAALGLVARTTRDVDVVAMVDRDGLVSALPLPPTLAAAAQIVGVDFELEPGWLNAGPAGLLDFGLPEGFVERCVVRDYGPSLRVLYASRFDQIHFKLYALVDQGSGRHEADLRALQPTGAEIEAAAAWARTHDPSQGFADVLARILHHLGFDDGRSAAP